MTSLLDPKSVAVIGASATQGKVGHDILSNLLIQKFRGRVVAVNPKGERILGCPTYASVSAMPEAVDLAVVAIPAPLVAATLRECGEKGIKNVVVITAGFKETHTPEGDKLEEELLTIAKQYNLTLVGPNCLGILRPSIGLNASFAKDIPPAGNVALISQSGSTAVAIMDQSAQLGLSFSAVFSIGNKTVLNEVDYLRLCMDDDKTTAIGLYLENIDHGTEFLETARAISPRKPIILLKAGTTEQGRRAAQSHTGALAGSDAPLQTLCDQAGIHLTRTMDDFIDTIAVLSNQPALPSRNIAIVTNAGGLGILAADAATRAGLTLPALAEDGQRDLAPKLPASASLRNPFDLIGDAKTDRYEAAIRAIRSDPNIDGIVVLLSPQIMTPCSEIADVVIREMRNVKLMPITTCFMGGDIVMDARRKLQSHNIPTFPTPERAINALARLFPRKATLTGMSCVPDGDTSRKAKELMKGSQGLLDDDRVRDLFSLFGLPADPYRICKTAEEAADAAAELGYPVAVKIHSPDILHKTDVGGVRLGLKSNDDVRTAFREIMATVGNRSPAARVEGVLVQKMLPAGHEFIVGATRDPNFGPLIMVGLGGIYTELFRDTVFRIAPIGKEDAYRMLEELRSWKMLLGMRGNQQSDISGLAELIGNVSNLVCNCPEIRELDLNPVIVRSDGVHIADAKIVVG